MRMEQNADKDLCAPLPLSACPTQGHTFAFTARLRDRDTGAPLSGAEYGLFQGGLLRCAAVSGGDGVLAFPGLAPGDYELRELAPPPGYLASVGAYAISIGPERGADGVTLRSVFFPRLSFYLLDAVTRLPLADGRFRLSNGAEAVSTAAGLVDLGLVPPGTYAIRQRSAPVGHRAIPRPLEVSVAADGRVVINGRTVRQFTAYNPPAP